MIPSSSFDKYSGGTPTVSDCKIRCEAATNCVGFQFAYGAGKTFSCTPIIMADASGCNVANSADLNNGRTGLR